MFRHSATGFGFAASLYRAWKYRVFKVHLVILEGLYAISVSLAQHQKVLVRDKFICKKTEAEFSTFCTKISVYFFRIDIFYFRIQRI